MPIKLIKSSFYNEAETKEKLCNFISNVEQLSIWKYCLEFEKGFSEWQWRKYCLFYNSWSSANLALVQAMLNLWRLQKWDRIGFSSLTWATNVMPLIELGLTPVPIDVSIQTLNVSLDNLKLVHERDKIKGLFLTNLLWFCDKLDDISNYCRNSGIILMEDNCESMWTVYRQKKLWNYGIASTFSTYVWHHMSTIEGGMVCTDDLELYTMLNMVRAHWWDRNLPTAAQNEIRQKNGVDQTFYSKYTFYTLGYNLRPNEINGFIGCEQLKYLDEIISKRSINFHRFIEAVNSNPDFYPVSHGHIDLVSNFAIPVVCKSKEILEKYIRKFSDSEIEIRPIVGWDMTEQIFWKELYWSNEEKTTAKLIHQQGFYFGNSPEYTEDEICLLISLIQ